MINLNFSLLGSWLRKPVKFFETRRSGNTAIRLAELERRLAKLSAEVAVLRHSAEKRAAADRERPGQTLQTHMIQDDYKRVVVRFIKNL